MRIMPDVRNGQPHRNIARRNFRGSPPLPAATQARSLQRRTGRSAAGDTI